MSSTVKSPPSSPVVAATQQDLPPGPRGRRWLGSLPEFGADVLGFLLRCREQYGDVVSFRFGPRPFFLLSHPDLIDIVLVTQHRDFIKHSFFWRHVTAIFGRGLVTNEGDSWLRQRRLAAPAFHRARIASYADSMVSFTQRMLDGWRDGEVRDIGHEMMAVTLEIVAKVLFDTDVASEIQTVGRSMDVTTEEIARRFRRPIFIPDWVPLPGNVRYNRAVRELDRLVYRMIEEHRGNGGDGSDLLSMLMQTRDEDGSGMSDRQLRDEAITLILAGHETTALTLTWTLHLLSRDRDVMNALIGEVDRVLGSRSATAGDLRELRFTEAVIQESMRLYPPAYVLGREAVRDCEIGGYAVPAGATILMSAWVMHRDPRWFADPLAFRPERWLDGLADRLPRHVYMPFGGGPRICIGNTFAMMEAVLMLATIVQKFRFDPTADDVTPFPTITLRTMEPVRLKLERRSG